MSILHCNSLSPITSTLTVPLFVPVDTKGFQDADALLITSDVRGSDSDQGSTSDVSDHGDRDNHGSDCRRSVTREPRDGGS